MGKKTTIRANSHLRFWFFKLEVCCNVSFAYFHHCLQLQIIPAFFINDNHDKCGDYPGEKFEVSKLCKLMWDHSWVIFSYWCHFLLHLVDNICDSLCRNFVTYFNQIDGFKVLYHWTSLKARLIGTLCLQHCIGKQGGKVP